MIRATRLCETRTIEVEHLGLSAPAAPPFSIQGPAFSGKFGMLKAEVVRAFEQEYLVHLMQDAGGNVTHAARASAP